MYPHKLFALNAYNEEQAIILVTLKVLKINAMRRIKVV